jgi:hypothetical protein
MSKHNRGRISFTVEALHETNGLLFDFLDKNFKVIDIDHSDFEVSGIIHYTLEDISDQFHFIHSEPPYHLYTLVTEKVGDSIKFRLELSDLTN